MKLFSGTPLSQFSDAVGAPETARKPAKPAGAKPAGKPRKKSAVRMAKEVWVAPRAVEALKDSDMAVPPARAFPRATLASILPASGPAAPRVIAIPRLAQGGRWRVEAMRSHSEPLLLWFTRGQGRITVAGETRGYGSHNAVFVPAGVMHGFEVGGQTFGNALFFGHGQDQALPASVHHLRVRDAAPQAELSGLIDAIQRELESSRPGHDRAARCYVGLVGVWLERQIVAAAGEEKRPDAAQRLVRRYAELLERDFRTGQGVGAFAHALGVTPTHLSRVCNQACGRSASDLLHDRVIFEARKLLSETRAPINEIAGALGFTSPAYFTRAFQHRTGKTPSAFRKSA